MILLVQKHGKQSLRPASVLNRLRGEEKLLRGVIVEVPVFWSIIGLFRGRIFEEEDDAVDRTVQIYCVGLQFLS